MAHHLALIKAKLDRAPSQLAGLHAEAERYVASDPFDLSLDCDPATQQFVARVGRFTPPPETLAVLLGEYVHNLRSALDQMICRVVEACGGEVSNRTAFPILSSQTEFAKRVRAPWHKGAPSYLTGAHEGVLDVIEHLQPYRSQPNEVNLLGVLADWSNTDKHRDINAFAVGANAQTPPTFEGVGFDLVDLYLSALPLSEGCEVARMTFYGRDDSDMEVDMRMSIDLRIGEIEYPASKLNALANAVTIVLNKLASGFEYATV
jgi:hypothetical protein